MIDNVSNFYETLKIINIASRYKISTKRFLDIQNDFKNDLFELIKDCIKLRLLKRTHGLFKLSAAGARIVSLRDQSEQLREVVKLIIIKLYPSIGTLLCSGANKASIFLPDYIKQILNETNLLRTPQEFYQVYFPRPKKKYLFDDSGRKEIGIFGEQLSLKYEKRRVHQKAIWIAKEDDGAGYDIESKVYICNNSPIFIEVKTTTRSVENANIFISRNEWETAKTKWNNYLFHIWITKQSKTKPLILRPIQLKKHIPKERGSGKWGNVEIQITKLLKNYKEKN